MNLEAIGSAIGNGLLFSFIIALPLWIWTEDWREDMDRKCKRAIKLAKAVKGSKWIAYVESRDANGWNCGKSVPVTILSTTDEYKILVKVDSTGEEQTIRGLDYLYEFISAPDIKKTTRRRRMPKLIRWGLYLALLKLVWMGVDNAPLIAQFAVTQFVH